MKTRFFVVVAVVAAAALLVVAHLALIEIGREVATLRTATSNGAWESTRLWVVDHEGHPWLHSQGKAWVARFENDPVVELERDGTIERYRAHADPSAHSRIDRLLREKYGLADRWVRLLAPCDDDVVPVRLDRLSG